MVIISNFPKKWNKSKHENNVRKYGIKMQMYELFETNVHELAILLNISQVSIQ